MTLLRRRTGLTTGFSHSHEPSLVEEALETTLRDLRVEYLDSYLMHWPVASIQGTNKIYYLEVSDNASNNSYYGDSNMKKKPDMACHGEFARQR
jgi:diketogulonate reductase-like aldo/keto reductase